ncbi:TPM domain-containing protein [Emcibacter sp. SYSU 3D8]|uniref:TPM domain-containing protein n=1 Tax=Emcibacter sp. SYSU 3D8 TaxID=3133969 RepID=UPI0031FEA258
MKLGTGEQARIEAAVAAAETRTSAEFALVLAEVADGYEAWPALWAALLALLAGGALSLIEPGLPATHLFGTQVAVLVVAGLVLHLPRMRPLLAPPSLRREAAARLARLQFAAVVQRRTADRIGVLLFVSLAEHHIEILVDRAIGERIPEKAWNVVVEKFAASLREGKLADGYIDAVGRCAALLEKDFPILSGDTDELPNRVTFI